MNVSSELWAHRASSCRVPFQGGIKLSAVLRRSDRIIAWGQHVNTDFTLLKQLKSHQRTLSICYNYISYNTLRNTTTSLIDFRTKKGKNEKIQWLLRRWFFTVLIICISPNIFYCYYNKYNNGFMTPFLFWVSPKKHSTVSCISFLLHDLHLLGLILMSALRSRAQRGQETRSRSHRGKKSRRSLVPKPVLAPYAMLFFPVNVFTSCGAGKH